MMREAILFLDFITFIVTFGFCVAILFAAPDKRLRASFGASMFGVCAWSLTLILIILSIGPVEPPGRLAFSFLAMFIASLGWFLVEFPRPVIGARYYKVILAALGIVFFIVPLLPSYVANIRVIDRSYIVGDLSPQLFPMWSLYYIGSLIFTTIFLIVRTLASSGVDRERLKQLLFGFSLFMFGHVMTQIVLPLFRNDFRWNNLGPVWFMLLLPFMVTAIFRYRLLDIRWILSKSLVFSAVTAFVVWILMGASYFLARIITPQGAFVVGTFLVALVIIPASKGIERWISKIFERGGYDPNQLMDDVFSIARTELDLRVFEEKILSRLMLAFGADAGAFAAFAPKSTRILTSVTAGFADDFGSAIPQMVLLMKRHPDQLMESAELEWKLDYGGESSRHPEDRKMLLTMQRAGVDLLIPLEMDGKLIAFIALGKRKFDRVLRHTDVRFLNLLRAGIAPAIENAEKFAEMQELYAKLQEADLVKSRFIDTISHQFRTPLASIRWNVETLLEADGRLSLQDKSMLREVQNNSYFLIRTLTLFVDVIQWEADAVKLEKAVFPVSDLAPSVVRRAEEAKAKGIDFTHELGEITVVADKRYLERALDEIVHNAIEYTSQGGKVNVSARIVNGKVHLRVEDTGIGMSDVDAKKRAFAKFYRGKNAVLMHPDGIGLGLYLVKLIAGKLGGDVRVDSAVGKGTIITLVLPAGQRPEIVVKKRPLRRVATKA